MIRQENVDSEDQIDGLLSTRMYKLKHQQFMSTSHCTFCNQSSQHSLESNASRGGSDESTSSNTLNQTSHNQKSKFTSKSLNKGQRSYKSKKHKPQKIRREQIKLFEYRSTNGKQKQSTLRQCPPQLLSTFSGQGVLLLPTGKKYEGQWIQGKMIGRGKITYPQGSVYQGQILNYHRHGNGKFTFAQGIYQGEFSGEDFHGVGTLYDKKGSIVYEGHWRRGKKYDL